jgi:putative ABC transport system permease protein
VYPPISYLQATQYKEKSGSNVRVSISAFVSEAVVVKSIYDKTNPNSSVVGGDENYLLNENHNLQAGRDFSNIENENGSQVAIIGPEVAKKLFPKRSAINKNITLMGKRFKVVGVLEEEGSGLGGGGNSRLIIIPLVTANQMPRAQALTYDIKSAILTPDNIDYAINEATGIMRKVRQDPMGQEDSFLISGSDSLAKSLDKISGYLRVGGFLVGFITLLGASIGLMNIMMVSVTERTREIGVRKALGATAVQIRQQFLIEAIVICVLGGLLGIFLGVLMGNSVSKLIGEGAFIVPWLWITVGLGICVVVGLLSGFYPAYKASKLDPIESLRYE